MRTFRLSGEKTGFVVQLTANCSMNVITMAASSRKKMSTEDFIVERVETWLIV